MLLFKEWLNEACDCWKGYKRKPGTKPCEEGSCVKEEAEQIDEISAKLAGNYYGAATKKHVEKVGVKPNMYDRIEKDMGKQRKAGVDRAMDRITGARKTNEEVEIEESTPYYNKSSFLKKMGRVAKQERLAREKKEKEAAAQKPVKEKVAEGLADDFLKMAHDKGYKGARIVTSDQKKKETADLIKKRAKERKKNPPPAPHHVPAKTGFRSGAMDDTYGT